MSLECKFCKLPVLIKDDLTSIPAHVVCVSRHLPGSQRATTKRRKGAQEHSGAIQGKVVMPMHWSRGNIYDW